MTIPAMAALESEDWEIGVEEGVTVVGDGVMVAGEVFATSEVIDDAETGVDVLELVGGLNVKELADGLAELKDENVAFS